MPAIALFSTGGAVGIAAIVLGIGSGRQRQQRQQAADAFVDADYATKADRSQTLRTGAIVCATIAGALVLGGVARYVVVARRQRATRVAWLPGQGVRIRF